MATSATNNASAPSWESLAEVFRNALQSAITTVSATTTTGPATNTSTKPAPFCIREYKQGSSSVEDYFRNFDLALQLSKISEEHHNSYAILYMGSELASALKFLASPLKSEDLSYAVIKNTLIKHFDKSRNKYAESIKFRQLSQLDGENIANFSLRLRESATYCEYGVFLDRMLLEQFLYGLKSREMCNVIIAKRPENFAAVYELAQSLEVADCAVADMKTPLHELKQEATNKLGYPPMRLKKSSPTANAVGKREPYVKTYKCNSCGGDHPRNRCRFRDAVCHTCKRKGHISRACRSQTSQVLEEEPGQSDADSIDELNNVNCIRKKGVPGKVILNVAIDGKSVPMELDTGAPCTLMSIGTLRGIKQNFKLISSNRQFTSYTKNRIQCLGRLPVNVTIGNLTRKLNLYVVDEDFDTLLGREWIVQFTEQIDFCRLLSANQVNTISMASLSLSVEQSKVLNNILDRYDDVFSNVAGILLGPPVTVHMKDNATPVFMKAREVPYALRESYAKEIDAKIKSGIFKRVDYSEWASTTHIVAKKNGKIRITGNYKPTVNKNMVIDEHPIPRADYIFNKMNGSKIFCHLDITDAYSHLQIDEQFGEMLTLNTPTHGLIRPTRAVYGAANIPAVWQRRIETVLQGVANIHTFFDDILVFAQNFDELMVVLETVLERLRAHGLKLNRTKCVFAATEVEFLGHRINGEGVLKSDKHVEAVRDAPKPSTPEALQLFLGKATYYSSFIPNLSTWDRPLRQMLKNEPFRWTSEGEAAYRSIKSELLSPRVLMPYDPRLPLILATDASKTGLGAVLSHRLCNGEERPIAFASRTMNPSEIRYPQIDKEALAIVWAVQKFFMYLYARHWILVTDNKPLAQIVHPEKNLPTLCISRMANYADFLTNFDFEVIFKRSEENVNADYCSRIPQLDKGLQVCQLSSEPDPESHFDHFDWFVTHQICQLPVKSDVIARETRKDERLGKILQLLQSGQNLCRASYKSPEVSYSSAAGCLIFEHRVVIPPSLRERILSDLHKGHIGIVKMKGLARSFVYWPGIDADIESTAKDCSSCCSNARMPAQFSSHHWEYPRAPWERIHIDYAGPIYGTNLLIITDSYSKWLEVKVTHTTTSTATIAILDDIFAAYGAPITVVTDNGSNFTSTEFSEFLKAVGVRFHKKTAPYHPATNGQAERYVQTIKNALKTMDTDKSSLHRNINEFLRQYRKAPHSTTGQSPSQLFLNRSLRTSLDLVRPDSIDAKVMRRQQANFDSSFRACEPGETVYFTSNNPRFGKWIKGQIISRLGDLHYNIEYNGKEFKRHINQIRKHTRGGDNGLSKGMMLLGQSDKTQPYVSGPSGGDKHVHFKPLQTATPLFQPETEGQPQTPPVEPTVLKHQDTLANKRTLPVPGVPRRSTRTRRTRLVYSP